MPIVQTTTHVTDAVARFRDQYKSKPNLNGLASIVAARAQLVENALYALLINRALRNATGILLDRIGGVVGLARGTVAGGGTDAVYAAWLGAQIRLNQSSGTAPDIAAILGAVAAQGTLVSVLDSGTASVVVQLSGVAQTQGSALVAILQQAKAAGVNASLDYLARLPAFGLDGAGAGMDVGYMGGSV